MSARILSLLTSKMTTSLRSPRPGYAAWGLCEKQHDAVTHVPYMFATWLGFVAQKLSHICLPFWHLQFRDELASVIWVLAVATSGNLLALKGDAKLPFARTLMQVCLSANFGPGPQPFYHQTVHCSKPSVTRCTLRHAFLCCGMQTLHL